MSKQFRTRKSFKVNFQMSKRDLERKQREEQEAAAHVFQEFITEFQGVSTPPQKTFVKSGVLYAASQSDAEKGQIYNPRPIIKNSNSTIKKAIECARILKDNKLEKRKHEKPKSNLELLKEELKQRHSERDDRPKRIEEQTVYLDGTDPTTTNIFVANLNYKVTEADLMNVFGNFGPLASVKIMWPRGDDHSRNCNCGFVAFMSRKDAERALESLRQREDMRVGWGKPLDIPAHPIYIPKQLLKLYQPPPFSGLPFNAQPLNPKFKKPIKEEELNQLLSKSVVKVTIPLDKKVLVLVHRVIEFVVREGPVFEAMIMNKEMKNPEFSFLFDYQSPVHIYYRWKLFSILNGDSVKKWSMKPFTMFLGGPIWIPPYPLNFTEGMPEELLKQEKKIIQIPLSKYQCNKLIELIKNLSMSRFKIAEAMAFCFNQPCSINDEIDLVLDSMSNPETHLLKKLARLYLFSDLLYNAKLKKLQLRLTEDKSASEVLKVFSAFNACLLKMKSQYDKDNLKSRIMKVLRFWSYSKIFPTEILQKLQAAFMGCEENQDDDNSSNEDPLDGVCLLKRSLKSNNSNCIIPQKVVIEAEKKIEPYSGFVPSKWDTVDPQEVEAQAMSTNKLYHMEWEKAERGEDKEEKKEKRNDFFKVRSKWDDIDEEEDNVRNERKKRKLDMKKAKYKN